MYRHQAHNVVVCVLVVVVCRFGTLNVLCLQTMDVYVCICNVICGDY